MNQLSCRLFRGSAGLDALSPHWNALVERLERPSYIHLWEWYRAYADCLAERPEALIFAAFYAGDHDSERSIAAILPFEARGQTIAGLPLRTLALPRHDHMPHCDILVAPGYEHRFDLAVAVDRVRKLSGLPCDVGVFRRVLADGCLARVLPTRTSTRMVAHKAPLSDALPVMVHAEFLAQLSKNFRGALRKARNKLAKLDGVEFHSIRKPADLDAAFARFVEVEASGWKGADGTAIGLDPSLRNFYRQLMSALGARGQMEINLLIRGDHTLAAQFAITSGNRLYVLKIGYDEAYKAQAPGNMLLERVLQAHHERAHVGYIDLVSDAAWHRSWKPLQRHAHTYYLFRRTPAGIAALLSTVATRELRPRYYYLRQRLQHLSGVLAQKIPWQSASGDGSTSNHNVK